MIEALPPDFLPRATRILLPRFNAADEREAWLAQAFFLSDPRLYHDLRMVEGAPIVTVTRTITALLNAACLPGRKMHALATLLSAVKLGSPEPMHREIDSLVSLLKPLCSGDPKAKISSKLVVPMQRPSNPLQTIETPEDERTPTVFISYAHADDAFAMKLISDLQNAGHAIWIDTVSIKGGDAWVRSIADGIRNSYAFVTLISPNANTSRWVLREYLLAENLGKAIYPVMARQADIPFQMIDRQVIMLNESYADGLRELIAALPAPQVEMPPEGQEVVPPPPVSMSPPPPAPAPIMRPQASSPDQSKAGGPGGMLGGLLDRLSGLFGGETANPAPEADTSVERRAREQGEPAPSRVPVEDAVQVPGPEESAAEAVAPHAAPMMRSPVSRADELQFIQRQFAVVFNTMQERGKADMDDERVRWAKLPGDAIFGAREDAVEHPVDITGDLWQTMGRAIVEADSAGESGAVVWTALEAQMKRALADPAEPLPVMIDLTSWDERAESLESFVRHHLDTLADHWPTLAKQDRVAPLISGIEIADPARTGARHAAVEAFLRAHPDLSSLVVTVSAV